MLLEILRCSVHKIPSNRIYVYVVEQVPSGTEKRDVMTYGYCDYSYSASAENRTYPVTSGHRQGSRSGPRCWGRRAARRPRRCRSGLLPLRHSHTRGWWACWCCWVKATHCPRWRWADSRRIAPASESRFSWWESRPCCLEKESKVMTHDFWWDPSCQLHLISVTLFSFFWPSALFPNTRSF